MIPYLPRLGSSPSSRVGSTQYAKRLIQYGVRRLYFERRPYEGCRGIEILILTGEEADPAQTKLEA